MIFPKFSRPSSTKMSEISINTVKYIDEVEQKNLLTTCTTKLCRFYRVSLHCFDFRQKKFRECHPPFINSPFITFAKVGQLLLYTGILCLENYGKQHVLIHLRHLDLFFYEILIIDSNIVVHFYERSTKDSLIRAKSLN